MKRFTDRLFISALALATFSISPHAVAQATFQFQGVEITALVQNFELQIKTLTRPTLFYNWSRDGFQPLWQKERAQGDPLLLDKAQRDARLYWDHYGQDATGNKYGWGLYGATDPKYSFSYGGGKLGPEAEWVLLAMELPKGFRMVSADQRTREIPVVPGALSVLQKFGCPETVKIGNYLYQGGQDLAPKCQQLIKNVVKDILKIDGFAYEYDSTQFSFCNKDGLDQLQAFVVTNELFIKPTAIRYYHSRAIGNLEGRRRIQTVFLPLVVDKVAADGRGVRTTITADEAQATRVGGLLWSDLEGLEKTPKIEEWIKEMKFGCSGEPTTQPLIR